MLEILKIILRCTFVWKCPSIFYVHQFNLMLNYRVSLFVLTIIYLVCDNISLDHGKG